MIPEFCVGSYKYWGYENREAPIRVVGPIRPTDTFNNFEVKSLDHTANHYVALAALIICGIEGLRNKMVLPPRYDEDASKLTEE